MATQQPLSARGLSRTVLTPPDILGERMQLEQLGLRQDALRASQMAKMPRPKFTEGKEFAFTEGKYFSPAQQKLINQYKEYMVENGVASNDANYGTQYFDENAYRRRKNMETNLARFLYQTKNVTDMVNGDIENLDPKEKSVSGFLDWAEGVNSNINETVQFDEAGNIVYGDGEDVFSTEYLSKPEAFYFTPVNWSKEAIGEIVKPYIDVESGEITTKQIDIGKVRNQARGLLDLSDNRENFQKSFASSYLQENYGLDPRQVSGAVNTLVEEGELQVGDKLITLDEVKSWAEDYIVDQVQNQSSFTRREDEGGGGLEFNFGDWSSKAGVTPLDAKTTFADDEMIDIKGGVAAKPGKYKLPVSREMFPDEDPGEVVTAEVDYLVTDGNDVYATVRGLRQNGSYLESRNIKLPKRLINNLEASMGVPENKTLKEILLETRTGVEESVDSEQEEIVENPTQEQYDALPDGAKYIYNGQTYTKGE